MALYRYEAVDRTGKVVLGAMDAPSEQDVTRRLAMMGYAPRSVQPARASGASRAGAPPSRKTSVPPAISSRAASGQGSFPVSVEPSVSLRALAQYYRQLATLVRAGMPASQAIEELSRRTASRRLRRATVEMLERVRAGDRISGAMANYPGLFPVHTVGTIWGGELGGYLDVALDEAATELEQELKDHRYAGIGRWFINLNIAGLILLVPLLNFKKFMIRVLTEAARLAGSSAPVTDPNFIPEGLQKEHIIKGFILAYIGSFVDICVPLFIVWLFAMLTWRRLKRVPAVRRVLDAALLWVPAWGRLHRERAAAKFLNSLHHLYRAGVAPAQAWAAASMSVRNSEYARRLRKLEHILRQPGSTLQQAIAQSGVFDDQDVGMVATGERAGSIPEMLGRLANDHGGAADAARTRNRYLTILIIIILLGAATGYLAYVAFMGYADFVFQTPKLLGLE